MSVPASLCPGSPEAPGASSDGTVERSHIKRIKEDCLIVNKSTNNLGHEGKSYLFVIQRPGVDARSRLVTVGRHEEVGDLRKERFEHAHIKPHGFIGFLGNAELMKGQRQLVLERVGYKKLTDGQTWLVW